jgi:hypothetical protein
MRSNSGGSECQVILLFKDVPYPKEAKQGEWIEWDEVFEK